MECSIKETFILPSNGIIYDTEIDPHITLRSMSTVDEMLRLSPSEVPYRNLVEMIDSCIINEPGISAYDMCMGDFQFLLYKLRTVTYGSDYKVQIVCPYCGYRSDEVINLDDLEIVTADEKEIAKYKEFQLPRSKHFVELNFETPRIIDLITEKVKDPKKRTTKSNSNTLLYTLSYFIKKIDGTDAVPSLIEDWISKLPMQDTNTILAYADKLNMTIGVQTKVQAKCDVCKLPFMSQIKTTSEFFRPSLDI